MLTLSGWSCKKTNGSKEDTDVPPPILSTLLPNAGYKGDIIRVAGKNFGGKKEDIRVFFGGQEAELTILSATELTVIAPDLSGKVVVQVDVSGKKSNFLSFQYQQKAEDPTNADKESIKTLLEAESPLTWVFTGNSITQGAKHTHGLRPYAEIFSERIRWEMVRSRDYVINTAISGNTLKNILDDFNHRVAQFEPQVVFCMIGTNDAAANNQTSIAQYAERLVSFITQVRGIGAIPVLLTPTPIVAYLAPERATLWSYVAKMKEVANSQQVILVDNWGIWEQELNQKYSGGIFRELLNDPLHPNGIGHKEIAISLFKALDIFDPAQPTGGAPYYEGQH